MIHSLIGQSEVLTLCGVYFLSQGNSLLGGLMIGAGFLGGIGRFMINFQIVSQNMQNESTSQSEDEKFARILSEISRK